MRAVFFIVVLSIAFFNFLISMAMSCVAFFIVMVSVVMLNASFSWFC
jgi:hypothetical protein